MAPVRESNPDMEVVPAYGMRQVGGYGVRGWRLHCQCGYLSEVYTDNKRAHQARGYIPHVCTTKRSEQK